eukprot:TRINITY_DN105654_c0_g1_i1.p1 TRINITY_DN105654_c0_g1~~TRINITY_DN105654_c0_g1_i1.p1  ORF type:complete len:389 (+),score=20.24 TRINITY_DN105654_c0_g1_i1:88-1254(+)
MNIAVQTDPPLKLGRHARRNQKKGRPRPPIFTTVRNFQQRSKLCSLPIDIIGTEICCFLPLRDGSRFLQTCSLMWLPFYQSHWAVTNPRPDGLQEAIQLGLSACKLHLCSHEDIVAFRKALTLVVREQEERGRLQAALGKPATCKQVQTPPVGVDLMSDEAVMMDDQFCNPKSAVRLTSLEVVLPHGVSTDCVSWCLTGLPDLLPSLRNFTLNIPFGSLTTTTTGEPPDCKPPQQHLRSFALHINSESRLTVTDFSPIEAIINGALTNYSLSSFCLNLSPRLDEDTSTALSSCLQNRLPTLQHLQLQVAGLTAEQAKKLVKTITRGAPLITLLLHLTVYKEDSWQVQRTKPPMKDVLTSMLQEQEGRAGWRNFQPQLVYNQVSRWHYW